MKKISSILHGEVRKPKKYIEIAFWAIFVQQRFYVISYHWIVDKNMIVTFTSQFSFFSNNTVAERLINCWMDKRERTVT